MNEIIGPESIHPEDKVPEPTERERFPRLLTRRSFLKELFLGTTGMVGAAITQKIIETIKKNLH